MSIATPRSIAAFLGFCLIFGLAFYLRQFTFWLPHWQGDQSQYVILAMKLSDAQSKGLADYNLYGVNTEVLKVDDPQQTNIIFPRRVEGPGRGFVLDAYHQLGLSYYDTKLFPKTPLFPYLLGLSHRIFTQSAQPFTVIRSNLAEAALHVRPRLYLNTQFWAAVIPFVSSLAILLLLYFWTLKEFGAPAALIASFIYAVNPVSVLTANRLWTEDLMTLFLSAAMFAYRAARRTARPWLAALAGVLMGLSILTNQKALLAAAALGVYTVMMLRSEKRSWFSAVLDPAWLAFLAATAAVTAHWFWRAYQTFGHPLWMPEITSRMLQGREILSVGGAAKMQQWYTVLLHQPHGAIYYSIGTAAICWPLVAVFPAFVRALREFKSALTCKSFDERVVFLWLWIGMYAAYFMTQRTGEYRYLFAAYPALIVVAAAMLCRLESWAAKFSSRRAVASLCIIVFLGISAFHSVRVVLPVLWEEKNLITAPWR